MHISTYLLHSTFDFPKFYFISLFTYTVLFKHERELKFIFSTYDHKANVDRVSLNSNTSLFSKQQILDRLQYLEINTNQC